MVKHPGFIFKVVVVGAAGVGKTSLVKRFVEQKFDGDYLPTTGANVMATNTTVDVGGKDHSVYLGIWDIAAQDTFKIMRQAFYLGSNGAFLVGDLTDQKSFEGLANWNQELETHAPGIPKILLVNKNDLERKVPLELVQGLGSKLQVADVVQTSALTGENVREAFRILAKEVLIRFLEEKETSRCREAERVRSAVRYLYILSQAGLVLYEHAFLSDDENEGPTDAALIGGALVATSSLLKEIAQNANPLKVVRQEGFSILVEEGQYCLVAVIAVEESDVLRQKIIDFLRNLENSREINLKACRKRGYVLFAPKVNQLVAKYFG